MARWFRSEDMAYVSIIVNEDAAHQCISDLGKLGMIQFTDLNPELTAFQRRYVAYIKRIDELERKLSFFGEEVRLVCCCLLGINRRRESTDPGSACATEPTARCCLDSCLFLFISF